MPTPNKLEEIFEQMANAIEQENVQDIESLNQEIANLIEYGTPEDRYECNLRTIGLKFGFDIDQVDKDLEKLCCSVDPEKKDSYLHARVFRILNNQHTMFFLKISTGPSIDATRIGDLMMQLDRLEARAYRSKQAYPTPVTLQ